jgi:glycosyltransferase involved in cell wall biosynthesis
MKAFAEVLKSCPAARLVLVGDGPVRKEIEEFIQVKNLGKSVILTGWQTELEICGHIQASRAIVLPSFYEGLPVVLMEALALGRPAVTTHVGGIPELVDRLQSVLSASADECNRRGQAGRCRVIEKHSSRAAGDKLVPLLINLISREEDIPCVE